MSKADRIGHLCVEDSSGLDPHYAGWFACFNRGAYYEAHDVLEALWLRERKGPDDRFYKGLIQLAGAFVHLQKNRLRPADALLALAEANLQLYRPRHRALDVERVLQVMAGWRRELVELEFRENPLGRRPVDVIAPDADPTPP